MSRNGTANLRSAVRTVVSHAVAQCRVLNGEEQHGLRRTSDIEGNGRNTLAKPAARSITSRAAALRSAEPSAASPSRSELIAEVLENDILSGILTPGMAIDERSISARFGVSRTPVRNAIAKLRAQGLVEVRPRSGSFVARVSLSEVLQLFEFMAELEAICAKYSTIRMDAAQLKELRRRAEACRQASAASVDAYSAANAAFHDLIYVGSGNEHLEASTRSARKRCAAYRRHTLAIPGRLAESVREHFRIVKAMERRDRNGAYDAMRVHIDIQRHDYAPLIAIFERAHRSGSRD